MSYWMVPLGFLLGAVAGGLLVVYWRSRSDAAQPVTRYQKIKLVAVSVFATVALIGISGYAFVRYRFAQSDVSQASEGQALADYRKAHGAGATAQREGVPAGGVYTYNAEGGLKVRSSLLGNEDRPLPKTIPAVLVPRKKDCWDLTLRFYKENHRGERYCQDDKKGLTLVKRWAKNKMFGIKTFTRQSCGPHGVLGPTGKPGSQWKDTWKVTEHTTSMPLPMKRPDLHLRITYVGVKALDIGGQKVRTHYLRQRAEYGGAMKGKLYRQVWYDVDTGMMVKLHVQSTGRGIADMDIDRKYTLASLTPKK
jgi:hypothetical protein